MKNIARFVLEQTGSRSQIEHCPLPQDDPKRRQPIIDKAKKQIGWVAPYVRESLVTGVAASGHGWTPLEAAEDAWAQFEKEFGSPPGTAE